MPGVNAGARRSRILGYFSLFGSAGTLICCALPSLLVLAGLGATVASFLSAAPWLVALSRHKALIFAASGALIAANVFYVYWLAPRLRREDLACGVDDADACRTADRMSRAILWMSIVLYVVGFGAAFVPGPLLLRFG